MYTEKRFGLIIRAFILGVCLAGALAVEAQRTEKPARMSPIAFISSRFDSSLVPPAWLRVSEIYLMNGDGSNVRRLTNNTSAEGFPAISPNGRRIVFDSDRIRKASDPLNWASLFVMNVDGSGEAALLPGNSASWSSDNKNITFHASASNSGKLITGLPGAAAIDSDIFILNVDEFLRRKSVARNLTNSPDTVDDDPDWSPDGKVIAYTSHSASDDQSNPTGAEIYSIDPNRSRSPKRLTNNNEEERGPDWSPDGKMIVYTCRKGDAPAGRSVGTFELCIMNADGSGQRRITRNNVPELGPSWSPDGKRIVFHRAIGGIGRFQLFTINSDGTDEKQITFTPGFSGFPSWGLTRESST